MSALIVAGLALSASSISVLGGYYYSQLGPIARKRFLIGALAGATTTLGIALLVKQSPPPQYFVETHCCREETGIVF